jgi:U3 small nucleolar RNA-associated protein 14
VPKKQEHNKLRMDTGGTIPITRLLDNKQREREEASNETTKAASWQPAAKQHKRVRTDDSDLSNCEAEEEVSENKEDGEQSEDGEDPRKQAAASQHVATKPCPPTLCVSNNYLSVDASMLTQMRESQNGKSKKVYRHIYHNSKPRHHEKTSMNLYMYI